LKEEKFEDVLEKLKSIAEDESIKSTIEVFSEKPQEV
jgi:hypothetical protein